MSACLSLHIILLDQHPHPYFPLYSKGYKEEFEKALPKAATEYDEVKKVTVQKEALLAEEVIEKNVVEVIQPVITR